MTLAKICTDVELQRFTGQLSGNSLSTLQQLRDGTESAARQYVRHQITYATGFVEFYPRRETLRVISDPQFELAVRQVSPAFWRADRTFIVLSQKYVKTITSVYEDLDARFGQGVDDFPAGSLLTVGTDYVLDQQSSGFSKTGRLIRLYNTWPRYPGTVKVTYTAGLTEAELADEYFFVKRALWDEIVLRYWAVKAQQNKMGSGAGMIAGQSIQGDFSERYDNSVVVNAMQDELMTGTKKRLRPLLHRLVAL